MLKFLPLFSLVSIVSIASLAGEINKIEMGDFRVEFQLAGKVKTTAEAKSKCAALDTAGSWRLPDGMEFWGTLMTGNGIFTKIPIVGESGSTYLAWAYGDGIPSDKADILISASDGHGTETHFLSLSETLADYNDVEIAKMHAKTQKTAKSVKMTLLKGIEVVCYRNLPTSETK